MEDRPMNVRRMAFGLLTAAALLVGTGCSCCHKSTVAGAPPCGCGTPGPVPAGAIPVGPPPVNTLSNASPCPNCVR
jgi:hypothetical protein